MKVIQFKEQNTVFAKDQKEYDPLPAHRYGDAQGRIACCWKLSMRERLSVLLTGKVWHQILTFDQPLQPQLLSTEKPDMKGPFATAP